MEADLLELATRIADKALTGEQVEVVVARSDSTNIKAYKGEVESLTTAHSQAVGIRIVRDGRQGFASCGTFDSDALEVALADARDNADFAEPDDANGIVEPDGVEFADIDECWHESLLEMPMEEKIARAVALEDLVIQGDPRITGVRIASWGDAAAEVALVTSTGITSWSRSAQCSAGVSALAEERGDTQIAGWSGAGRDPGEVDIEEIASEAVKRATRLLGATKPPSARTAVVLEPHLAATVFSIVAGMLCGDRLVKGRTPFAGRVGEQIASPMVELVDDPTDNRSLSADPVDGEGLATRRNPLIVGGVLDRFLHDGYTGRRTGSGSTGSAVRGATSTPGPGAQALWMRPGEKSFSEVVADLDEAILVQSLVGLHSGVNPVSGDFSCGADGIRIRNGAEAEPLREFTIAGSIQRLIQDVAVVAGDLKWLPSGDAFPTIVITGVSLSGS